jgi:nitrite reductase/ring-hydroxylating ferredoxin subunit
MDDLNMAATFAIELDGRTYRLPKHCPHRSGHLNCGYLNLDVGRITCPLHGATFDIRTGRRLAGPDCPDLEVRADEPETPPPAPGPR